MATASNTTPLFGRRDAIESLLAAAGAARDGSGGLLLLSGDPGIGKTRMLDELGKRARQDGMRVLVGAAGIWRLEARANTDAWTDQPAGDAGFNLTLTLSPQ